MMILDGGLLFWAASYVKL